MTAKLAGDKKVTRKGSVQGVKPPTSIPPAGTPSPTVESVEKRTPGAPAGNTNGVVHGINRTRNRKGNPVNQDRHDKAARRTARQMFAEVPGHPQRKNWTDYEGIRLRLLKRMRERGVTSNTGEVKNIVSVFMDITQRQDAIERELARQQHSTGEITYVVRFIEDENGAG